MGIAKKTIEQVDGGASLSICMETCSDNTRWGGQIETALEVITSTGGVVSEADTAVAPNVESHLQEERQSSCCKKRGRETAEGEPPPKQLKKQPEEAGHQEASGIFLDVFLSLMSLFFATARNEDHSVCPFS